MNSDSLPTATTPRPADDTEVLSQRILDQGEIVMETPSGKIPIAGHMGGKTPMDSDNEGRSRILLRNPQWFRIQAGSLSLRGASRLC